jgi:FMN phosphatase YigB (HAD superfamily)
MPKRKHLVKCLALDAMGVIFTVGDDVKDLLYPFIIEKRGINDFNHISETYEKASLGEISAQDFWYGVGLDPALEDEYLCRHKLSDGLVDFLPTASSCGIEVWCLSNDLAEWSQKLRCNFGLNDYLAGAVISGEVGLRKPDPAIYHALLEKSGYKAVETLFVDDNVRNLDAAAALNFQTVLFDPLHRSINSGHKPVSSFRELQKMIF